MSEMEKFEKIYSYKINQEVFEYIKSHFDNLKIEICGDYEEKEFLKTNSSELEEKSNKIFEFTLIVTLLIYIYFFIRNYKAYEKSKEEEKGLYTIKLLGSSFLIAGIICLIYFQTKQNSFIGSPSL